MNFVVIITVFIIALVSTHLVRLYAIKKVYLDIPNERSSHTIPTPRGGGLAIIVSFFCGLGFLLWQKLIPVSLGNALLSGGSVVALAGYIDDRYTIAVYWRLAAHIIAAGIALFLLQPTSIALMPNWILVSSGIGQLILLIAIVWLTNLYNFMDGIDGLAGIESCFVCFGAGSTLMLSQVFGIGLILWMLAASCAGFLVWNWPPAKIFMGDISSGLLGYSFAVIAIYTAKMQALPVLFWLILLAVFVTDASFTLLRRMLKGEKWYAPHRSHAYQCLVLHGCSHRQVILAITAFNSVCLLPMACLSLRYPVFSLGIAILVYLITVLFWYKIITKPLTAYPNRLTE